ncbi:MULTISPECIES: hypothetical protein [Enterococcus]|uniref:hypothetical protein n=1 Tax=Enterococcus TaxID=1350 RepID=UPI0007C1E00C|nr:hypothetical protein [Enterococcus hirae]AND72824.1 hypothetical protein A6P53_08160 [Enterococcus hirae]
MEQVKIFALEYAVSVFNEIISQDSDSGKFKIVWNTDKGFATCETLLWTDYDYVVLSEELGYERFIQRTLDPSSDSENALKVVRFKLFDYFRNRSASTFTKRPDQLLLFLLDIIDNSGIEDLEYPNYSTIRNFKTLDGLIDLPFILNIDLNLSPVSLIKEQTTTP